MLPLLLALAAATPPPVCGADELVVLGCEAKKKTLAICAGPKAAPTWVQYRFGPPGKPEMVFPKTPGATSAFRFARRDLASGSETSLVFGNEGMTYEVWSTDGRDGGAGVNVLRGSQHLATVACSTDYVENWDRVEALLTRPAGPPAPLEGRSQKEICNDDALLLLKYAWDDLREDGFRRACCVKAALGDDDRCQLDWPSSDVPACSEIDLLRNRLFALYGYTFKDPKYREAFTKEPWYRARADFQMSWLPPVAQKNVARLKTLVANKGCVQDEPSGPEEACKRAAGRLSTKAFEDARGHMDGVQQGEIYEAVLEQCLAGWGEIAVVCFSDGAKGCEVHLTEPQQAALRTRMKEIVPED